MKVLWKLVWPLLMCLILPLIAAWFAYPVTHLPPKFGVFPPEFVQDPPGFNLFMFCAVLAVEIVAYGLYLFPKLYGFKPVPPPTPAQQVKLPVWFWIGLVFTGFFLWLMWARVTVFGDLVYYAFSPLWWGFILVLDGITYRRSGGKSLLASKPNLLFFSALISVGGWYFFEYFNYFVLSNWYYPYGQGLQNLPHASIVVLFLIAYSTVWPAIFEWYTLLNTFPSLSVRFSNGPKLALPGNLMLWGGLAMIFVTVFFPYPLFWVMWIGPLAVLSGTLIRNNIWSPFTAMAQGDWGPALLVALSSLCNGIFWELWNWGSNQPAGLAPTNPNYWIYDIPYVNVIHICAEMPILGYFGYLPFGILVWVFFIWIGKVLGVDTDLQSK
jgi:hypothetical protein